MRHRIAFRKLGRTMEHRKALRRNLAQSLFEHGQILTTLQKAKDLRPFAERLITLAKRARGGDLVARRRIARLMGERYYIPTENQADYDAMSDTERRAVRQSRSGRRHRSGQGSGSLAFTSRAISHRLIHDVAGRYEDRPGGYTRVIRVSRVRVGDSGAQAILQLVGEESRPGNLPKPPRTARARRADARYAAVMKGARRRPKAAPGATASGGSEAPPAGGPADEQNPAS